MIYDEAYRNQANIAVANLAVIIMINIHIYANVHEASQSQKKKKYKKYRILENLFKI
jgi:hypothetical protein